MAAWDTACCGASKGGVWWDTQHTQKATASNFGPVITALQLYGLTGNASYLSFGTQVCAHAACVYWFVCAHMRR